MLLNPLKAMQYAVWCKRMCTQNLYSNKCLKLTIWCFFFFLMLSCSLRNLKHNKKKIQSVIAIGFWSIASGWYPFFQTCSFPLPVALRREGRKGGWEEQLIKTKPGLADKGCILYSELNNVARGQLISTKWCLYWQRSSSQFMQIFPVHWPPVCMKT